MENDAYITRPKGYRKLVIGAIVFAAISSLTFLLMPTALRVYRSTMHQQEGTFTVSACIALSQDEEPMRQRCIGTFVPKNVSDKPIVEGPYYLDENISGSVAVTLFEDGSISLKGATSSLDALFYAIGSIIAASTIVLFIIMRRLSAKTKLVPQASQNGWEDRGTSKLSLREKVHGALSNPKSKGIVIMLSVLFVAAIITAMVGAVLFFRNDVPNSSNTSDKGVVLIDSCQTKNELMRDEGMRPYVRCSGVYTSNNSASALSGTTISFVPNNWRVIHSGEKVPIRMTSTGRFVNDLQGINLAGSAAFITAVMALGATIFIALILYVAISYQAYYVGYEGELYYLTR